jgi:hypothetical protein
MSIALASKKVRRGNSIVADGMTVGGEARMALSVPVLAKALMESCHRFSDLAIRNRASAAFSSATAPRKMGLSRKAISTASRKLKGCRILGRVEKGST